MAFADNQQGAMPANLGRAAAPVDGGRARIAVHGAVLHDHGEMARPDQHRLVLERIAVDQENIGEGALLDHPEFALVAHEVATNGGGTFQRLGRRVAEELDEMANVAGVLAHRGDGKAIIATDHDAHAAPPHLVIGGDCVFELARRILPYERDQAERVATAVLSSRNGLTCCRWYVRFHVSE